MAKQKGRKPRVEKVTKAKACTFCKDKKAGEIDYKDTAVLRRVLSDRGKIRSRRVTGLRRRTTTIRRTRRPR